MSMAKRKISQWWFAGLAAMFPAGVLIPSSALALAARQGGDGVRDGYGRAMLALIVLGGLCALGSVVALLVAWCAAVLNARLLPDRRWYSALLWGGIAGILMTPLLGLGVLIFGSVMTAYLVAGPDGVAAQPSATIPTKRVITRWSGGGWGLAGIGLFVALLVPILTGRGLPLHGVLWPSLATTSAGYSVAVAGAIIVGAAWWAAIFNAHLLADKTWFRRLRWTGVAAALTMPLLGFGALILLVSLSAYVRRAPDGLTAGALQTRVPTLTRT
jgi:hypothetical protein